MTQTYGYAYHTYPVYAEEMSIEGAFKRYMPFPGPQEIYDFALMGLPKIFPLTKEPIKVEMVTPYLNSAITEIEMDLGCNLSEVQHFHSEDYIDGMFQSNFQGTRLQRWPATQIVDMKLKYPHTNTQAIYQTYTIPSQWIYLRRNKVNVVASVGSVTVNSDNSSLLTAGGIFTYITGFGRGPYQPGTIEIVYKAGFQQDKLPSSVVDLIKTWAAWRWLIDLIPVLFPTSGVSVSIDGVAQSVNYQIQALLTARLQNLEQKKKELSRALEKQFSKTIKMTFLGA